MRRALGVALGAWLLACTPPSARTHNDSGPSEAPAASRAPAASGLTPLPPLQRAPTTAERTFTPSIPAKKSPGANPALPEARAAYLAEGRGERREAAPWPTVVRVPGGGKAPTPGPARTRLLRFAHLTDAQLADDESPLRGTRYDSPSVGGAMRPHEDYGCRLLLAAARTLRAVHTDDPLDMVLLGGDNLDNAQHNELTWFLQILGGAPRVECDSGADDDPRPGPNNDAKDAFAAPGLGVPWLWVTGNHDVNVQGLLPIDDTLRAAAVGSAAFTGTRNHSKPGGPAELGMFVVADSQRALLSPPELLQRVLADGDGHGLDPATAQRGRANYAWDAPGGRVRVVVIDTSHPAGGANGVLQRQHVTEEIAPLLDQAKADGKWVIVAAHHATEALSRDGGAYGKRETDAMLEAEWLAWLGRYPNVIASLVGHSHRHQIRALPSGSRVVWEVMTSALIDYPSQMRLVELFDEDNGWLSLHATLLDLAFDDDPIGEEGRARGQLDFSAGWLADGRGAANARNVVLWIRPANSARKGR